MTTGPVDDTKVTTSASSVGGTAARRARQAAQSREAERTRVERAKRTTARPDPGRDHRALQRELDPDRLVALEEERDFLLRSLEDLEREHDVGDVDEHDYTALKDDYTVRAAATLRAIETRHATMDAVRPRSPGRTWAVVAVVAVLAIGLGVFVAASPGRRGASDSLTGDIRQSTRDDLLEVQQLLGSDPAEAIRRYDAILERSPDNTEALTYRGWLLFITSGRASNDDDRNVLVASALRSLSQAVELDPTYADARIFRAMVFQSLGQIEPARADLASAPSSAVPPDMVPLVDRLRGELDAAAGAPGTTSP